MVRYGISRLPRDEEKTSKRKRFVEAAIGYVHIDVCGLRLTAGTLFMFLAIDRFWAVPQTLGAKTNLNGAAFLRKVAQAFPCRILTVLTDNGAAFTPKASTR